jgi:hypothetical protein
MRPSTIFINRPDRCQAVVRVLLENKEIALDIEGKDLGRHGTISLIQIFNEKDDTVYLFDIYTLGKRAFSRNEGNLKTLLESDKVQKLIFDVRADADALFHLYNVKLQNVFDIQILFQSRFDECPNTRLMGLGRIMDIIKTNNFSKTYGPEYAVDIPREDTDAKEAGKEIFIEKPDAWELRPIPEVLMQYAAVDVKYLIEMKEKWGSNGSNGRGGNRRTDNNLNNPRSLNDLIRDFSQERANNAMNPSKEIPRSSNRDFFKPTGFRVADRGKSIKRILVPTDAVGLLIGKRGATIDELQRKANVAIRLENAHLLQSSKYTEATVIGESQESVEKCARLIKKKVKGVKSDDEQGNSIRKSNTNAGRSEPSAGIGGDQNGALRRREQKDAASVQKDEKSKKHRKHRKVKGAECNYEKTGGGNSKCWEVVKTLLISMILCALLGCYFFLRDYATG